MTSMLLLNKDKSTSLTNVSRPSIFVILLKERSSQDKLTYKDKSEIVNFLPRIKIERDPYSQDGMHKYPGASVTCSCYARRE